MNETLCPMCKSKVFCSCSCGNWSEAFAANGRPTPDDLKRAFYVLQSEVCRQINKLFDEEGRALLLEMVYSPKSSKNFSEAFGVLRAKAAALHSGNELIRKILGQ